VFEERDIIEALTEGSRWIKGEVLLASENQKSLALAMDEGCPIPFTLSPELGCVVLMLFGVDDDGTYRDIATNREWKVRETGKRVHPSRSKAEAFKRHMAAWNN
jgi:hypothetical protein